MCIQHSILGADLMKIYHKTHKNDSTRGQVADFENTHNSKLV